MFPATSSRDRHSKHQATTGPARSRKQQHGSLESLASDIHKLAELLSPQTALSESTDVMIMTETLMTRIALTLKKETNTLLFLDEPTIATVICCMQTLLDGSNPIHDQFIAGHRHILRRLLVKVCRDTGKLPSALFLSGVKCDRLHSVAGGSFSDIYQAEYGGERVALKRLRVFQADPSHRATQFTAFCREAVVWRQLRHPHILSFLGVDTQTFEPSGLHCMVSPWMDNGSLSDIVAKADGQVDRWVLDRWVYEIAEGLDYLHEEHVVHGDLRGANILVDSKLSIKLSDFGLSKFADASTASWGTHTAGALRWMAPEVLGGVQATFASDVYSFGCVCSELYTARRPFSHITNDANVVVQILKGARPDMPAITGRFADILRPLVLACWNNAPSTRPASRMLSDALRPSVVKDEFGEMATVDGLSNIRSTSRVSTPVSYLRVSSSTTDEKQNHRRSGANHLATPTVFRPLQPQSSHAHQSVPTNTPTTTFSSSSSSSTSSYKMSSEGVLLRPDWLRPPRILIVDNTSAFQETGARALEDYGCVVESAKDGARAMDMCDWSNTRFDLVFMRLNGASATYLIRDYDKKIPIIALQAGGSKPEDVLHNHYHLVQMNDVLPSSPSNGRLLGTIEKYLCHLRRPSTQVIKEEEPAPQVLTHAYRKRQGSLQNPAGNLVQKRSRAN